MEIEDMHKQKFYPIFSFFGIKYPPDKQIINQPKINPPVSVSKHLSR